MIARHGFRVQFDKKNHFFWSATISLDYPEHILGVQIRAIVGNEGTNLLSTSFSFYSVQLATIYGHWPCLLDPMFRIHENRINV